MFGDKPRVKLLDALVDLAPYEFTLPDLIQEADLDKNVYRDIQPLISEGLIEQAKSGPPATFRVRADALLIRGVDIARLLFDGLDAKSEYPEAARAFLDRYWNALRAASNEPFSIVTTRQPGTTTALPKSGKATISPKGPSEVDGSTTHAVDLGGA